MGDTLDIIMTSFNPDSIKIVASDLDDTILRTDLTFHPFDVKMLKEVEARGIHVVFSSGLTTFD